MFRLWDPARSCADDAPQLAYPEPCRVRPATAAATNAQTRWRLVLTPCRDQPPLLEFAEAREEHLPGVRMGVEPGATDPAELQDDVVIHPEQVVGPGPVHELAEVALDQAVLFHNSPP